MELGGRPYGAVARLDKSAARLEEYGSYSDFERPVPQL
jgi:hypothetical protein